MNVVVFQVSNIDDVLGYQTDFLNSCLKDCMLTNPDLLKIVSKLLMVCVTFSNFIQVRNTLCSVSDRVKKSCIHTRTKVQKFLSMGSVGFNLFGSADVVTKGDKGQMGRFPYPACACCTTYYILSSLRNCHRQEITGFLMGILCVQWDADISQCY